MTYGVTFLGSGRALGEKKIKPSDLESQLADYDATKGGPYGAYCKRKFDTEVLHEASENQTTATLLHDASVQAIEDAGLSKKDIDWVVLSTITPDDAIA